MYMNVNNEEIFTNIIGMDNLGLIGALTANKHAKWSWSGFIKGMEFLKSVRSYSYMDKANYITWPAWVPGTWNSVCITSANNITRTFSNGQLVATVNNDLSGYDREKNILLLATSDEKDENLMISPAFGSITDVNIWNRSLSQGEVNHWSTFQQDLLRDKLLDWSKAKLRLTGTQVEELDFEILKKETLFESSEFSIYTLRSENSFQKGKYNCEGTGGVVSIPGDNIPLTTWNQSAFDKSNDHCKERFYTGYSELYKEGEYVSLYSNTSSSSIKWAKGTF